MPRTLDVRLAIPGVLVELVLVNATVSEAPGTDPRDQLAAVLQLPAAVFFQSFSVPVMV